MRWHACFGQLGDGFACICHFWEPSLSKNSQDLPPLGAAGYPADLYMALMGLRHFDLVVVPLGWTSSSILSQATRCNKMYKKYRRQKDDGQQVLRDRAPPARGVEVLEGS